uniref:Uncharacterized protein n=1 Tax=Suricata suricatta TaxID=37032 RepID=A0A673TAU8_SURSU
MASSQGLLPFRDVAIGFSQEEDVMLENYGHLFFLGCLVSKPDLVIFLEKKQVLWDVKRKETVASYPAVSLDDTEKLLPKIFTESSFQRMSVDTYKPSAVENEYLVMDWKKDGESEGHQRWLGTHFPENDYECNKYSEVFGQSANLIIHKSIHLGENPSKYNECGKILNHQSSRLHINKTIYTGQKGYICEECGNAFNRHSALIQHQKVHTGENAYKCVEGGKPFNYGSSVNGHRLIPTGEKPYTHKKSNLPNLRNVRKVLWTAHPLFHIGKLILENNH